MKKLVYFSLVFVFLCSMLGTALSGDWLCWRGPNGDGISSESNWNAEALKNDPKVVWETNLGRGHSAVVVQGNRLYTMGNRVIMTNKDTTHVDLVFCLDTKTGNEVWSYSYPCDFTDFPGPRTTPLIDGERVYTLSWRGDVFCFNSKNGNVIWKRNIVTDKLCRVPEWGFSGSPVIVDNIMILNAGKSGLALDKNTGKVIWKNDAGRGGLATPVLFNHGNKKLAAIMGPREMNAIDIKTGEIIMTHPWTTYTDPTLADNLAFLTGYNGGCKVVDLSKNEPEVLWQNKRLRCRTFLNFVIIDGYAYGYNLIKRKQYIRCIEVKTGEIKWSRKSNDWGALMAANGKLIILDGEGNLVIVEATPEAYKEISGAKVIQMKDWKSYPRDDMNACWTAPVLANGFVYARNTYGDLVCVDVRN